MSCLEGVVMNRINISRHTAAKMIHEYMIYHYCGTVNVRIKSKLEENDLTMIVKLKSVFNNKRITEIKVLNEGQIADELKDYFEMKGCTVDNIVFEPYFHNISIDYDGELNIKKYEKKVLKRVKHAI